MQWFLGPFKFHPFVSGFSYIKDVQTYNRMAWGFFEYRSDQLSSSTWQSLFSYLSAPCLTQYLFCQLKHACLCETSKTFYFFALLSPPLFLVQWWWFSWLFLLLPWIGKIATCLFPSSPHIHTINLSIYFSTIITYIQQKTANSPTPTATSPTLPHLLSRLCQDCAVFHLQCIYSDGINHSLASDLFSLIDGSPSL